MRGWCETTVGDPRSSTQNLCEVIRYLMNMVWVAMHHKRKNNLHSKKILGMGFEI